MGIAVGIGKFDESGVNMFVLRHQPGEECDVLAHLLAVLQYQYNGRRRFCTLGRLGGALLRVHAAHTY